MGTISFPGISAPQRAIVTRTTGCRPSSAIIYAQPQPGSPTCDGTATFIFGMSSTTITMHNVLCDRGTLMMDHIFGHVQVFELLDRRWMWCMAYMHAAWNVRAPDGTIIAATQQTLTQIVQAIFTKMDATLTVDLTAITSTELPEIISDYDNCVDLLDEILIPRGYIVSLMHDDTAKVFVRGTGATLPNNNDVANVSLSVNPPETPLYLTAVCDNTVVQSMLKLVPVGLDTDGSIKLLASLSYYGGGFTDYGTFNNLTDPVAKECASRSVGKWFQIQYQADGTQNLAFGGNNYLGAGGIAVSDATQLLPLEENLLSSTTDIFGKVSYNKPFVTGTFFDGDREALPPKGANTPIFTRVDQRDLTIDRIRGLVMFKDLALMVTGGAAGAVPANPNDLVPATCYLTCAYSVHDTASYLKDRVTRQKNLGGYGEKIVKLTEIQRRLIASYTAGTSTVSALSDTLSANNSDCDLHLNAAANQFQTKQGNILLYRGTYGFDTDGVNLQVRWDCAVPGPVPWGTHVAQNWEGLPLLPTQLEQAWIRRNNLSGNPFGRKRFQFHALHNKGR